jgi:rSAM/selenodomain-associated transferase 2
VKISVVIPVYRDATALARTLASVDFHGAEVIVAATAEDRSQLTALRAQLVGIRWVESDRGRARQMNAGAAAASGEWLVFLHADTLLPPDWWQAVTLAAQDRRVTIGCFRFALDSRSICARIIELGVRLRVSLFRLPYGDQALFVRRRDFEALGGYADLPIMEDVDLVRRFCAKGHLYCSPFAATTSARKWERDGWVGRSALHLRLIVLYFLGVPVERLAGRPVTSQS